MASKRQLILDLLARDQTGPATKSAADNLEDVGDAAKEAARDTEKLGKESDKAEDQVERLGKSSRTAAQHVERLDREIESVEHELKQLAVSFAEAETAAERLDLSKAIRRTESDLKKLNKSKGIVSALVPDDADVEVAGKSFAGKLAAGIGDGLAGMSAKLGGSVGPTIGTAVGIAAAPHLAGALASGLSSGAGLGILGVGIVAAVKSDKQIQEAGKDAGKRFMTALGNETVSLRQPVLDSLDVLSHAGDRFADRFGDAIDGLSGELVPFTRQIVTAAEAVTGPLLKGAKESGPALDGLGDGLILLGKGVGDFISTVADGGPEAADNIRLLAGATGDLVALTGGIIGFVNEMGKIPGVTGIMPILKGHYRDTAKEAISAADAVDGLVDKIGDQTIAMNGATAAAVNQLEAMQHLNAEIKAEADPLFAFVQAQSEVTKKQTELNKAIKAHGPNSEQAAKATRDLTQAAIGLQGAASQVGIAADGKLSPALRRALVQAGLTQSQIRGVETELSRAKAALDRYDRTNAQANVSVAGLISSQKQVKALQDQINRLHGKTVTIRITQKGEVLYGRQAPMLDGARAGGGPVSAGKAYLVGEKRPEVFVPQQNGTIIPSVGQAARGMSGGGDGGWVAIRGDAIIDALTQAIASRVSAKGGRAAQLGIRFTS